jgi:hypothetical protein
MSETPTKPTSTDDLETQIEAQRDHLAQTVDQLAHKLDPKAQAQERLADLKDRATTDSGKPRPQLVAAAAGLVAMAGGIVWWRRR